MNFWSGLLNAGTSAATGALQGQDAAFRARVAEAARQAAAARQARLDQQDYQLKSLAGLVAAAHEGLDVSAMPPASAPPPTISRRSATGAAPTSPEGGQPATTVSGPAVPPDAAQPVSSTETGVPKAPTGETIGEVAGMRVSMPPGGLQSRALRDSQAKSAQAVQERRARLQAYNDGLPPKHPNKMTPQLLEMVAGNDVLFNKWAEKTAGLDVKPPTEQKDHFTFITTTGPDGRQVVSRANTSTGAIEPTDAAAKAGGSAAGKPTEGQIAAGMFAERMKSAEKILAAHEAHGKVPGMTAMLSRIPVVGADAVNALSTPEQQMYHQAQEDWVRAKLRKESGAAIGVKEMEDEIRTYFHQPTDSPEVDQQKAERRREATRLLEESAGAGRALYNAPAGSPTSTTSTPPPKGVSTGDVDLRTPAGPRGKPSLAERVQQLKAKGLSRDAAKAQLRHEGYDLHGGA